MKKLYQARLLIYSLGLLFSSIVERFITNVIKDVFHLELILYHVLSLVILIVLFIFTNILLRLFMRSTFITKRVFGREYVGGRWLEVVTDEGNNIVRYCDMHIDYDEDRIFVSGTNYDMNLQEMDSFETKSATMDNFHLTYLYVSGEDDKLRQDSGRLKFRRTSSMKSPNYFSGFFRENDKKYKIRGHLISSRTMHKKLDESFTLYVKEILPILDK